MAKTSTEFFYLDENGKPSDADLHAEFLTEEAEEWSRVSTIKQMLAEGWEPADVEACFGPIPPKEVLDKVS